MCHFIKGFPNANKNLPFPINIVMLISRMSPEQFPTDSFEYGTIFTNWPNKTEKALSTSLCRKGNSTSENLCDRG